MQKTIWAVLSLASLVVCLLAALLHFLGKIATPGYRLMFNLASIGWFIFATLWARRTKKA